MNKIESGPECERCNGTGVGFSYEDCPTCYGTGWKALSKWTADECAKVLFLCIREFYFEYWEPEKLYKVFKIIWVEPVKVGPQAVDRFELLGEGKTLTEALRAAVAAVANEKK